MKRKRERGIDEFNSRVVRSIALLSPASPRMKLSRHSMRTARSRASQAGFSHHVECLLVLTLLCIFASLFLPVFSAVRHRGGGPLRAVGIAIAVGLGVALLIVAIILGLAWFTAWRDARREKSQRPGPRDDEPKA
jgi:protein-S-isoprenylcysteine O-methyltransferase Ste14